MHLNVLIIDGHRPFAEALALAIHEQDDLQCMGSVASLDDAIEFIDGHRLDVAVLAVKGSCAGALATARVLCEVHHLNVVVLAEDVSPELVTSAGEAGVTGLLSRSSSLHDVVAAIRSCRGGRLLVDGQTVLDLIEQLRVDIRAPSEPILLHNPLTPRELEVLQILGEGLDPQQIATHLIMSVHTARGHVKNVMMKLGAHSQLQAVVIAAHHGLLPELAPRTPETIGAATGPRAMAVSR